MPPVKRSPITITQFPIFDLLYKELNGHDDVMELSNREVVDLFLKVVNTVVVKSLKTSRKKIVESTDSAYYTDKPTPLSIPSEGPFRKDKKAVGYKWETVSRLQNGHLPYHVAWRGVNIQDEDECYAAFYLYHQRVPHQYPASIVRNLLQSFILFTRGEKNFTQMWALGLMDPCAFTIASAVNTYNRMVSNA